MSRSELIVELPDGVSFLNVTSNVIDPGVAVVGKPVMLKIFSGEPGAAMPGDANAAIVIAIRKLSNLRMQFMAHPPRD